MVDTDTKTEHRSGLSISKKPGHIICHEFLHDVNHSLHAKDEPSVGSHLEVIILHYIIDADQVTHIWEQGEKKINFYKGKLREKKNILYICHFKLVERKWSTNCPFRVWLMFILVSTVPIQPWHHSIHFENWLCVVNGQTAYAPVLPCTPVTFTSCTSQPPAHAGLPLRTAAILGRPQNCR